MIAGTAKGTQSETVSKQTISLLLVDDDRVEGELVQGYLDLVESGSIQFHQARDVDEAIAWMQGRDVDCLLLDNRIKPGESFAESAAGLRRGGYAGPIILFTQHDAEAVEQMKLAEHADGYLWKGDLSSERIERLLGEFVRSDG